MRGRQGELSLACQRLFSIVNALHVQGEEGRCQEQGGEVGAGEGEAVGCRGAGTCA